VFIYDASASTQEHDITTTALLDLEHVIDVVIVPRPSHLPAPGAEAANATKPGPKRVRAGTRRSTPSTVTG
jgi:hypothetical protein